MLGKVGLGALTPGETLGRVVAALPYYCSHEQVTVGKERAPIWSANFSLTASIPRSVISCFNMPRRLSTAS